MLIEGLQPLFGITESPLVIAGPCSAETKEQMLLTARGVAAAGVPVFRAGVWKPRTKPGGFEGRGSEALGWLREVREQTGMSVATEVATYGHLREAVEAGVDGVWIGARTSANPFAVQELADALAELNPDVRDRLTVLVKNPVNPDLELWIGAIERIYRSGVRRLGAVHRGFSSYGKHLYRNPPRWSIPIELRRRIPGLPLVFDPSHVAGDSSLVERLLREAAGLRFDGYLIESHCRPSEALSDASQQVTPVELDRMLKAVERRVDSPSTESLEELRGKIDRLDDSLIMLLARRMEVSREIGDYKRENRLPVLQTARYNDLMERRVAEGERLGLSPDFVRRILASIHEESVRQQL